MRCNPVGACREMGRERRLKGPRICHAFESTSAKRRVQGFRQAEGGGTAQRDLEFVRGRVYRKISSRSSRFLGQEWPRHLTARSARDERILGRGDARTVCGPRKSIGDRFGVVSLYIGWFTDHRGFIDRTFY